ncbi:MAG TPA: NC domain-containing protein [Planktothrix sp. UBA8407]|jgi:Phage shock protein A (IM30), suppresses sigma54-dependent transcription|nr:NC domain-containing protein [Planktothrix sp. UBA8402]HAO12648.1 NC domain-containing protein [Planktothrix sp. UBA8407]HBK21058.1 NC domain-containing protein [Planktothrix sp. UBA10369]
MARGDQIYIFREFWNFEGLYEHHGIDFGDGTVIHYRKPSEIIERTSIETFSRGKKIHIRQYPIRYIADTVLNRAQSRLGEKQYNLLFNNCEHFATWCVTGVSKSQQVENFIPLLRDINIDTLSEPLKQAFMGTPPKDTNQFLNQALAEIRVAWDDIHPQYKQALAEMNSWHQVAMEALKRNREDLAKEAIKRKLNSKKRATELEENLEKLASMTQKLLQNQTDNG